MPEENIEVGPHIGMSVFVHVCVLNCCEINRGYLAYVWLCNRVLVCPVFLGGSEIRF